VRITTISNQKKTRLQVDYFVSLTLGCIEPLGMDSGVIPDSQITASSVNSNNQSPARARLNNLGWTAALDDLASWLQIDLGSYNIVTRLASRGSSQSVIRSWVTSYRLQHSDDGFMFLFYQEPRDTSAKVYLDFMCSNIHFCFAFLLRSLIIEIFFSFSTCRCLEEIKTLSLSCIINSVSQSQRASSGYCLFSGTITHQWE